SQEADGDPILIKKYPNRRLYNTATSSYIVLDDIVTLVKGGTLFRIEDAKSGADLTRSILNQIIYEREPGQTNYHFPLEVQKQLIMMYDDAYGKMVPEYLRESMRVFVSERDRMKETFEEMVNFNSQTMARFSENIAKQNLEVFNRTFEFFQNMSGFQASRKETEKPVETGQKPGDREAELTEIQNQIDALQERLKSLK
ncbi:MAG: polyhydroxyalkanoate synthesis regulator DNA-binding domain-containing protein, partial [Pseudomonadota bacterium]